MAFGYIDHEADIGIFGRGRTLEEAFEEAARAMFNLMAKLESVDPREQFKFECSAGDLGSLLVEMLNELLAIRDIEGVFFSDLRLSPIERSPDGCSLKGFAIGERMDLAKHEVGMEVKAATYFGLKVEREDGSYIAQCVLDV